MGWFNRLSLSRDIGIDLGTANTLVYISGKGIVLEEPSVIAVDQNKNPIAVGEEAKQMLGRTPENVTALRPLRDGVIADFYSAMIMLTEFIQRANQGNAVSNPRMVIGIPSGITEVERRAVIDAAKEAGAREVGLIEEPFAAALGAGLPVMDATGNMMVDIGGGTTEVAILNFQRKVVSESVRVAGDELTNSIIQYLKRKEGLNIGERTAEEIKIRLGAAYPSHLDKEEMEVRGLHLISGLPKTVTVSGFEIRESLEEAIAVIVAAVKRTLERMPPELASDIIDRGIVMAGGGALLHGIDQRISHETGIVTHIADDPLRCVVKGTGEVFKNPQLLQKIMEESARI